MVRCSAAASRGGRRGRPRPHPADPSLAVPNGGLDRALEACNSCLIDASRQSGRAEPGAGTAALGLKAFLIADVRGYTRYTSEQGEPAAARMADLFVGLGRESVEGAGGVVIGVRGDEIAGMFDSPRRAVEAAIDLQERVAAELPLPIGVGLDVGEVEVADGNYVSGALNLASRLCDLAGAGEILATDSTAHLARNVEGVAYRPARSITIRGLSEHVRVVRIERSPDVVAAPPPARAVRSRRLAAVAAAGGVACVALLAVFVTGRGTAPPAAPGLLGDAVVALNPASGSTTPIAAVPYPAGLAATGGSVVVGSVAGGGMWLDARGRPHPIAAPSAASGIGSIVAGVAVGGGYAWLTDSGSHWVDRVRLGTTPRRPPDQRR